MNPETKISLSMQEQLVPPNLVATVTRATGSIPVQVSPGGPIYVQGMHGLGDNIYQRPFIKALAKTNSTIQLETPWPELYSDISNIRFIKPPSLFRTQTKNIKSRENAKVWCSVLPASKTIRIAYAHHMIKGMSVFESMEKVFAPVLSLSNLEELGLGFKLDLPDFGPSPIGSTKPIAVVRPVTVRKEWKNESRNPLPKYICEVTEKLRKNYCVVSVADLELGREWLVDPSPLADIYLLKGELKIRQLLALVQNAAIVVGGVGWIVPAALAMKVPTFVILGGNGGFNAPYKIADSRIASRIGFASPRRLCLCTSHDHRCDKTIPNLDVQFSDWADKVGILH